MEQIYYSDIFFNFEPEVSFSRKSSLDLSNKNFYEKEIEKHSDFHKCNFGKEEIKNERQINQKNDSTLFQPFKFKNTEILKLFKLKKKKKKKTRKNFKI